MLNTATSITKIINGNEMNSLDCTATANMNKCYDYTLKYIMIGDSDIGKEEIFEFLDRSNQVNSSNLYDFTSPVTSPQTSAKSGL